MNTFMQLKVALIDAPQTLLKLKSGSLRYLCIYFIAAIVIFGSIASILLANEDALRSIVMTYFFPSSWHGITNHLINFFFESQAKIVISNLIISGSVVAVSIFLFPLKEAFSATFEQETGIDNGSVEEFSLIYQGWEECKLFFIYLTVQLSILWIGYYPFKWANYLSIILSYLFLFFSLSLDSIAPTLQRHKISYSLILKGLFCYPVLTLFFGMLYSLPVILLSSVVMSIDTLSLLQMSVILFMTSLIFLAIAVPGGTWVALKMYPCIQEITPPAVKNKLISYVLITIILLLNLFFHSRLAQSLHHKSQFLKCYYSIDWGSMNLNFPSWKQLTSETSHASLSFVLETTNPTEFDLIVERSTLSVVQNGNLIAALKMDEFSVKSGETVKNNLAFNSEMDMKLLSGFGDLLDGWEVNLQFELWPGIPFMVNIIQPE